MLWYVRYSMTKVYNFRQSKVRTGPDISLFLSRILTEQKPSKYKLHVKRNYLKVPFVLHVK